MPVKAGALPVITVFFAKRKDDEVKNIIIIRYLDIILFQTIIKLLTIENLNDKTVYLFL